ncbi:hypothetical protein ACRAWD_01660 [Caulobacter segnis]
MLQALSPAERIAFVLHDLFDMPFEQIALDRRAHPRRRPSAGQPSLAAGCAGGGTLDAAQTAQKSVVDAFLTASRTGDLGRADGGVGAGRGGSVPTSSAAAVRRASCAARRRSPTSTTASPRRPERPWWMGRSAPSWRQLWPAGACARHPDRERPRSSRSSSPAIPNAWPASRSRWSSAAATARACSARP